MPTLRVYYAHALCLYGTKEERAEIEVIRRSFDGRVVLVNPSTHDGLPEKLVRGMEYCFELVGKCDCLVFTRLLGKITAGVAKEINHALSLGRPVYELRNGKVSRFKRHVRGLSREETRKLYLEWAFRRRLRRQLEKAQLGVPGPGAGMGLSDLL